MLDPDYELFAQVVEAGSLSAAGRSLGISPAMVSKRMARLEERLSVRLVHRTTRRLAVTEAGARFHADLATILASVQAAEARVTGVSAAPSGPLRISAPTSFGRLHVAPHLHRFLDANPAVALEFNLSDGFDDLLGQRIDLAIRIAPEIAPGLVAHRLGASRRLLCAAPAYIERYGAPETIAALAEHRLLAATGQMPWRLVNDTRRATVDRPSAVLTNSSEIVRELALTGAGIALRSLWDVGEALERGALIRVLPQWEGSADVGIYAVHPAAPAILPAVTAFVVFLREIFVDAAF
ncbi:MAG: LysR family transcriptional regulator [Candidatus Sphingomonas colombiensis]|nr:LysR family transcriptional regulator [Sphingomonas sp.]WEK43498.1 MAG: LysR family transcriptional regulator [Sphingomonas sp.]